MNPALVAKTTQTLKKWQQYHVPSQTGGSTFLFPYSAVSKLHQLPTKSEGDAHWVFVSWWDLCASSVGLSQSQRQKQNFKAQVGLYTLELSRALTFSSGFATGKINNNRKFLWSTYRTAINLLVSHQKKGHGSDSLTHKGIDRLSITKVMKHLDAVIMEPSECP